MTGRKIGVSSEAMRSNAMAFRRLKPKSFLGAFCLTITSSLGGGNSTNLIGGNGRLISSKACTRDHRYEPCDSPTGLSENGGVAKDEFVVSVSESALGEGDVAMCKWPVFDGLI